MVRSVSFYTCLLFVGNITLRRRGQLQTSSSPTHGHYSMVAFNSRVVGMHQPKVKRRGPMLRAGHINATNPYLQTSGHSN